MWKNIGERQEDILITFTDLNNKDTQSLIQCSIQMLTILRENWYRSQHAILLGDI
jgi:hypothetical protein